MSLPAEELESRQRNALQALLDAGVRIPSRPALLDEIGQCMEREDANLAVAAALIKKDPGLTGALFSVVHSAAFGLGMQAHSIEDALMALGQRRALHVIQGELLRVALGSHEPWFRRFWERAVGIAQMSAALAPRSGVDFDLAYLAGLFHDGGAALMVGAFGDYCGEDCKLDQEAHWLRLPDRDRLVGLDHALAGYLVARAWKLPGPVADAVLHHHSPVLLEDEAGRLVAVLQLAMHLYNQLFAGGDSPEWNDAKPWVLRTLRIDKAQLEGYV